MEPLTPEDPGEVGRYQLLARLGSGGMGRVYLARSAENEQVALKVIQPELARDPVFRRRFEREVEASRSVAGPFTAGVLDADPRGTPPWLATAYIRGPSLHEAVRAGGALPERSACELGLGLVHALTAIHAAGVVHRDLKPGNVLLAPDGPRVIDFGISRVDDASVLTHTGTTMGSPGYMAPEQIQGKGIRPAVDVFALGAVLVFASTGAGPFGEGAPELLLYRIMHEEPYLDAVPDGLLGIVAACLDKDPARRPGLHEVAAALGSGRPPAPLFGPGWLPGGTAAPRTGDPRHILVRVPGRGETGAGRTASAVQPGSAPPATTAGSGPAAGSGSRPGPGPAFASASAYGPGPGPGPGFGPASAPQPSPAAPGRRRLLLAAAGLTASAALGFTGWRLLDDGAAPKAGAGLWRFPVTGVLVNHPRVAGDLVYAASNDGTLYAVDVSSGEQRWSYTTGAALGSAPCILGGVAYLGSDDGRLYALDARTGRKRWEFRTGGIVHSPTVTGGVAYIGSSDGYLYAVDVSDGSRLWRFRTGHDTHSPVIADETVYVGCSDTRLYAVDASRGTRRWTFTTGGAVSWFPVATGGLVYFGSTDQTLYAVRAAGGREVWRAEGVSAQAGPLVARDTVYCGSGRELRAWDATTGKKRWSLTTDGDVCAPALADGVVYAGSGDQKLYAVDADTGARRWTFTAGAEVHPPTATADAVYFGGADSRLYAVRT
ncbi:PQQ-binding-like beta-propeller repeat protein [Streptomyces sp. NBC_01275]|uniref:outer membrane protein assembly factor BamB family protein n=1 Tax=Streptomyces sp. NBC_01275 TaxID=2903807 RepID=UPI00224F940A|nr:PQQ-binding-like beta-propeller repeat protein [Streptomyces sp. NBC_01275]MCX4760877.1 PQQ-binding-like beta-propeller repeat protein [Streptomyces sp. NBC_01275]